MNGATQTSNHWWGRRWLQFLQELALVGDAADVAKQLSGTRVRQLEVGPGQIDATVHVRERGDCRVTIKLPVLDDAQWEAVLDALAGQAIFSAQLLAGDMPQDVERLFAKAGARLLPADVEMPSHTCSCCTSEDTLCKPLLATYVAVGEMLNDDPWLLFRLRGRDRQQILRGLRIRRNRLTNVGGETAGADAGANVYRTDGDSGTAPSAPELAGQLDNFWGSTRAQLSFQHHIARPTIELALLRRLGPAPFDSRFDAFDTLAAVYRRVTDAGYALAFAPEPETDAADGENAE